MLARVAESLPNVTIRDTTPAQRQNWYSTPAGQLVGPKRYAEIRLNAFDPPIPMVDLTLLLWEDDGPIDGVHAYLGHAIFAKVERLGLQLNVQEFQGQSIGFGAMNQTMGQNRDAGMTGKHTVLLLNYMKLTEIKASQGPAATTYDRDSGLSDMSHLSLPSLMISPESNSNFQGTMSTPLFSDASFSAATITSLDSIAAPTEAMAGLMKNPNNDVFLGYDNATHDDDLDADSTNPTSLMTWEDLLDEGQY
jgi:hypothetical protein